MKGHADRRRLAYLQALGITVWQRRSSPPHAPAPGEATPEPRAASLASARPRWQLWVADAAAAARWRPLLQDLCRLLNGPDSAVDDVVAVAEPTPAGTVLVLCDARGESAQRDRSIVHAGDPQHWAGDADARRALWRRLQGCL